MSSGLNKSLYNIDDSKQEYNLRNIEEIASRWDTKANIWDEQLQVASNHLNQDGAYDQFIIDAQRLIDKIGNGSPLHLLEAGCGTALVSEALQKEHINITGIDISEKMLEKAREKQIHNATFIQTDVFAMPIEGVPLANIFLSRGILLSHYNKDDAEKLLITIKQCCVQEGAVVMLDFLNNEATDPNHHRPDNKTYYALDEIKSIAQSIGCKHCWFTGLKNHRTRCVVLSF